MSTPTLEIQINDTISVNGLVQQQAAGYSVLRSAHVGNLSPYNLTLANVGIPILSIDHTITGIDRNYRPEQIRRQTGDLPIADVGTLVCRTQVERLPPDITQLLADQTPRFLDQAHIEATRRILTNVTVFTNTDYLRHNERIVGELVTLAAREFPACFSRLALPDGTATKQPGVADKVKQYGIMQLNDDPRAEQTAVIMPNVLDILANFVVETLATGCDTQYHLSGPDMVNYISGLLPELSRMYERVCGAASFGPKLPMRLQVQLVPTAAAKFATTAKRAPLLDALLGQITHADMALANLKAQRKGFFTSAGARDKSVQKQFIQHTKQQEVELETAVAERLAHLPELLVQPSSPHSLTQYDILDEGGLYVPNLNQELSMAKLAELSQKLRLIQRRCRT